MILRASGGYGRSLGQQFVDALGQHVWSHASRGARRAGRRPVWRWTGCARVRRAAMPNHRLACAALPRYARLQGLRTHTMFHVKRAMPEDVPNAESLQMIPSSLSGGDHPRALVAVGKLWAARVPRSGGRPAQHPHSARSAMVLDQRCPPPTVGPSCSWPGVGTTPSVCPCQPLPQGWSRSSSRLVRAADRIRRRIWSPLLVDAASPAVAWSVVAWGVGAVAAEMVCCGRWSRPGIAHPRREL